MKHSWPTLYKVSGTGAVREWSIEVDTVLNVPRYKVTHGVVGGSLVSSATEVSVGKNIGRANETSAWDQCCMEAQALWNKQKDRKGYSEKLTKIFKFRPMLAKAYNEPGPDLSKLKDGKHIKFSCLYQPKLDGIRCNAMWKDGKIVLLSRQGKEFTSVPHIIKELTNWVKQPTDRCPTSTGFTEDIILDGELYIHNDNFQDLTSAIRKDEPTPESSLIEYHIYDIYSKGNSGDTQGFNSREMMLAQLWHFSKLRPTPHLIQVPTKTIRTPDEIKTALHDALLDGYEGIMLRNAYGVYGIDRRSADLQKVKIFIDEEFEIVGAEQNKGKQANQCTLICKTKNGDVFGVKPKGTNAQRAQYWNDWNAGKLKGKMLTVRFFEWSTSVSPVPRFPVGLSVRDYE